MIIRPFWVFESYIGILKPKQSHGIGLTMGSGGVIVAS